MSLIRFPRKVELQKAPARWPYWSDPSVGSTEPLQPGPLAGTLGYPTRTSCLLVPVRVTSSRHAERIAQELVHSLNLPSAKAVKEMLPARIMLANSTAFCRARSTSYSLFCFLEETLRSPSSPRRSDNEASRLRFFRSDKHRQPPRLLCSSACRPRSRKGRAAAGGHPPI